ncbi:MAG: hypothetical protein IIT55_07555, partial [Bacteroidaceae bacterium]|nr:hypothetical protein [Bacteroidaceae bacterium]
YLETVFPKPESAAAARSGLDAAVAEMDKRYRDQRFLADRAINTRYLTPWQTSTRSTGICSIQASLKRVFFRRCEHGAH